MQIDPDAAFTDPSLQLTRDIHYQIVHTLRGSLPPPLTDSSDDIARRDNAFIAQVAAMLPANANEANIGAQHVGAQAQAMACLREANRPNQTTKIMLQCTAQAASMMRQANATRSLLLRIQAARQKREANNQLLDQANILEHCTTSLMIEALGRTPPAPIEIIQPEPQAEPSPDTNDEAAATRPSRADRASTPDFYPAAPDFMPSFDNPAAVRAAATG